MQVRILKALQDTGLCSKCVCVLSAIFKDGISTLWGLSSFLSYRVVEKYIFIVQFATTGQNNVTLKEWYDKLIDFSTSGTKMFLLYLWRRCGMLATDKTVKIFTRLFFSKKFLHKISIPESFMPWMYTIYSIFNRESWGIYIWNDLKKW